MVFRNRERWDETLRELFRDSLDRNFHHGDSFPSLVTFDMCVKTAGTPEVSDGGTAKEMVKMDIEKGLPSVFGSGGRCEVDGWVGNVDVEWSVQGGVKA